VIVLFGEAGDLVLLRDPEKWMYGTDILIDPTSQE
jgi:uncharacterized membrane protein